MTQFFKFEELTWPEVKALPRSTPLVIPLGDGYPLDDLAQALGPCPDASAGNSADYTSEFSGWVGLLPPLPFGWPGSGISVPSPMLEACLANLLDSLADDGFSHVWALTPQGLDLHIPGRRLSLPTARKPGSPVNLLPADSERGKVILIPIGHTEQHGYHLPLSTDTIIIDAISQDTAARLPEQAYSLPVTPYGVSMHRPAFAGTLNAGGRAFEDFWVAVIDVLAGRGFDRFYFLSGHGGNMSFLVNVVKYAGERHPRAFCATAFLYLSGPQGTAALENRRKSKSGGMGHACELETSLVMHLRPDLVHQERAVDEMDFISTPSYYMDWVEGGALVANPPWDDDTKTGAYGAGSLATAENGQFWLEAAVQEKLSHIAEIHEQQTRREARRQSGYGRWGYK